MPDTQAPPAAHDGTKNKRDTPLDLILLLDRVAVGRALGGVDQLVRQALSNRLDAAERRLSCLRAWCTDTVSQPTCRCTQRATALTHSGGRAQRVVVLGGVRHGTHANGQQVNRLVDPAQRGHIHGLPPYHTTRSDPGGVLTAPTIHHRVHQNLRKHPAQLPPPRRSLPTPLPPQ